MIDFLRNIIPKKVFRAFQPAYHFLWAFVSAVFFRFPSGKIKVLAITGTKGKSSTAEFANAILEEVGYKTALLSTIRFKIGGTSRANLFKMSMPGRSFVQKFLHDAVKAKCDWVVMEITSEGIKQYRHKFIELDALIFTNLEPEHIESHGSFENYLATKLKLKDAISHSHKRPRTVVANTDNPYGEKFLEGEAENKIAFRIKDTEIRPNIPGDFMILNAGLAESFAKAQGIDGETIKKGIASVQSIPGRVKFVRANAEQSFDVVVDYAHTPGSLEALYKAFPDKKKICILGNTGGGRDTWKRPVMGKIASDYCDHVILTNEDPYDEDPNKIVDEMKEGMEKKPEIIMDRREAIAKGLSLAHKGDVVLISGKGTDPYIMEANGKKTPWSDEEVALEELQKPL